MDDEFLYHKDKQYVKENFNGKKISSINTR